VRSREREGMGGRGGSGGKWGEGEKVWDVREEEHR